jgi:hypothetical protein
LIDLKCIRSVSRYRYFKENLSYHYFYPKPSKICALPVVDVFAGKLLTLMEYIVVGVVVAAAAVVVFVVVAVVVIDIDVVDS